MPKHAYQVISPPERLTSVVFASPHSGRDYPWSFVRSSVLDAQMIRSSEDAFVDDLFSAAPSFGAPLLIACAPRAYVDLNRSADELDPALIDGLPKGKALNPRIASGLGVVPRVVAGGRAIYRGKLPMSEVQRRIDLYWHPYHARLQNLLNTSYREFGMSVLVDCHSMPHEAVASIARLGGQRPDVVLGDRFGAAADESVVDRIERAFVHAGLRVVRNTPFAGAYTAQHYGRPSRGQHAVQIEIDRSLYMDEKAVRPNENFNAFKTLIDGVVADVARFGARKTPLAAE
ncbi:N-formylglutamate amidohydrolase [Litorivita pollutaquae]|uniref:N-formylglutamate amidohydrolase n=1 Tax=Litorivita pollutaquae TaxID=2200892 RepID=A0A2V4MNE7_9RHOB|nr:N-formylglutamate amidohydrolase [Litorivita pollutaquae]PYC47069.1 N-formylglutamate amidohydrolase [Litorivita pollutaquae]